MPERLLSPDRQLLTVVLATLLISPLSLAAQERDTTDNKPATKNENPARKAVPPAANLAATLGAS